MVDDEPLVMEMLQTILEEHGYKNFVQIDDSRQAIEAVNQQQPDVLLLDLKMPHLDGIAILETLRKNSKTQYLSVIVLTSSDDSLTKLRVLELGATDFLAKPVDPSELVLRLRNTLTIKAYQDKLAYYDPLTKLPNRKLFIERLQWAIKFAERENHRVAVMNVAIDRFQQVNNSLGTRMGDQLLQQIAGRLISSLRKSDASSRAAVGPIGRNIARLSGDEFAILLPIIKSKAAKGILTVATNIREILKEAFLLDGNEVFVTASIGVAIYPNDAQDSDTLMKQAGAATTFAKENGRDCFQFYSKEISEASKRRLSIESGLRRALDRSELSLYYQPKVDASTEKITGVEALLRWERPSEGLVMPGEFIPIAEETGIITQIGEWVLEEACRQSIRWNEMGFKDLQMSINVSTQQFRGSNFPNAIEKVLKRSGLRPQNLFVEITEGMLIGDIQRISDILFEIKATGCCISIDDFGTGYSSFNYLKSFPIDELKIDRSFIIDIADEYDDQAIVSAMVAMAKLLELSVVAEGVEHIQQLEFLQALECDTIQGYYYSRPLSVTEFEAYYRTRNFNTKIRDKDYAVK